MKTIYKYALPLHTVNELLLPAGAKILHAGLDPYLKACIWAEVETTAPIEKRKVYVFGTGQELDVKDLQHLCTFQMDVFVWHVYL